MIEISPYILEISLLVLVLLFLLRKRILFKVQNIQSPIYSKKVIRNPLPYYVNGWFFVCNSFQLAPGQVIHQVIEAQNLAIFRGHDRQVYCISAYCGHLGANLAIGGKVVNQTCLQCPFHGWLYNGKSGECETGGGKTKQVIKYSYPQDLGQPDSQCNFNKQQGISKNKKYRINQIGDKIYVWIHALQKQPTYFPLDISDTLHRLSYRGHSQNFLNCHIQDVPENGADVNHFQFVHMHIHRDFKLIQLYWDANWKCANELKAPYHQNESIARFKSLIFQKHLKGQDLQKIGILNLQLNVKIPFIKKFWLYNITGIQLGPGVVYLFINSFLTRQIFFQYIKHSYEFNVTLCQQYWAQRFVSWIFSYFMVKGQALQISYDGLMWSNKQQVRSFSLVDNPVDQTFLRWKKWFMQFYQGNKSKQEKNQNLVW